MVISTHRDGYIGCYYSRVNRLLHNLNALCCVFLEEVIMADETQSFVCSVLGTAGLITIFFTIVQYVTFAVTPF